MTFGLIGLRNNQNERMRMPRYRFEVFEGLHRIDPEVIELHDLPAAQREGARRAGAALVLDARHITPASDWRLDVSDEAGTLLCRFDVSMTLAPAAKG